MISSVDKIAKFRRFGSILTLDRVSMLLHRLGDPQDKLKVIHVAGTNGKGSVSRYIYEVLRANGYKTGIYTSPYIEIFNERIEFDGEYISDHDLSKYTDIVIEQANQMIAEGLDSPTEFEIITAIGFLFFAEKRAEYVVLEVGLGGIGDSTNVIKSPLVSVIVSVSMDHIDVLGDTIDKIAREKAGIIKQGCPVVSAVKEETASNIIKQQCLSKNKITEKELENYFVNSNDGIYNVLFQSLKHQEFDLKPKRLCQMVGKTEIIFDKVRISMLGDYQIENAVCALTAIQVLADFHHIEFNKQDIKDGMFKAKQKCRFEIVENAIIDGAHNQDGAKSLADTMSKYFKGKKILMVFGLLKDKDINSIVKEFSRITNDFIITEPNTPRKLDVDTLKKVIMANNRSASVREETDRDKVVSKAWDVAQKENFDVVLFAGSFYLVGELRSKIISKHF